MVQADPANSDSRPSPTLRLLRGALLVCVGTGVGVYAVALALESREDRISRKEMAELEAHAISIDNPPSPDSFYPISVVDEPPVVSGFEVLTAADAEMLILPDELVLGVEIDGESRAYLMNMMTGPDREVFNDSIAGHPIVVTWCHLCSHAIVFDRTIDGEPLTFKVSGMLWEGNLVMMDTSTRSLWNQILGRAMRGPQVGARLTPLPSQMTTWEMWKTRYPDTTAVFMDRTSSFLAKGFVYPSSGIVIGLDDGIISREWMISMLYDQPVVNDQFGDDHILVVLDKPSLTASIFNRNHDATILTFSRIGWRTQGPANGLDLGSAQWRGDRRTSCRCPVGEDADGDF